MNLHTFTKSLHHQYPGLIFATSGDELRSTRSALRPLLLALRDRYNFTIVDLVVTDRLRAVGRFALYYVLVSHTYNARIVVTICGSETIATPSVKSIFPAAG